MRLVPAIGLVFFFAACAPVIQVEAQQRQGPVGVRVAFDEGYRQGLRIGQDHGQRRQSFNFSVVLEYRRADYGYRPEYGSRDRYCDDFRVGFEQGYREAYGRYGNDRGFPGGGGGYAVSRYDIAAQNGFRDGYDAGLDDGRHRHADNPVGESRFRSGNHGYDRRYGPLEFYKQHYRDAFREGYERGYRDGRPYYYGR